MSDIIDVKSTIDDELEQDEILQLAENTEIEQNQKDVVINEFAQKRELLAKTKIVRQTWSISEIYQKTKEKKLILDPDYQRNPIWNIDKQTAFIESLFMEIMIPPIYVVEIPGEDILDETKYEVVDGKQRLTAIIEFISGKFKLNERNLEYFADVFGNKEFSEIREIDHERIAQMLSSILDIYVITANSPEFTKYDIFARLNRGAEKLKVNEIRRAIYKSKITNWITEYVKDKLENSKDYYESIFTANDIKRYEDYGRLYRTVTFYLCSNADKCEVEGYNSRPREMINNTLQDLQKNYEKSYKDKLTKEKLYKLLDITLKLKKQYKGLPNIDYMIDALIPFYEYLTESFDMEKYIKDPEIASTFEKSPATTSNVNKRLKRVKAIIIGDTQ